MVYVTNDVTDIIQYVNKAVKQPKKFTITNSPKNNKNNKN